MQVLYATLSHWDEHKDSTHLASHRKPKMQRYVREADRLRCMVGWLLVQYALGEVALTTPMLTENGKPYYNHCPHFNISHSGNYVAVALSNHEVGVDVEEITPYPLGVAEKCFTPQEVDWIKHCQKQDIAHGTNAFYAVWTAKESIMKATGLGFSLPPSGFDVLKSIHEPSTACVIDGKNYFLQQKNIAEHMLCVASLSNYTEEPAQIQWDFLSRDVILAKLKALS